MNLYLIGILFSSVHNRIMYLLTVNTDAWIFPQYVWQHIACQNVIPLPAIILNITAILLFKIHSEGCENEGSSCVQAADILSLKTYSIQECLSLVSLGIHFLLQHKILVSGNRAWKILETLKELDHTIPGSLCNHCCWSEFRWLKHKTLTM